MNNYIPKDLIEIILRYAGKEEILLFQDTFPKLLKYVIVDNLDEINKDNYKYIQQINAYNMTNNDLKDFPNLTSLDLSCNDKITNEGIKHLTNLTSLDLFENNKITDEGIKDLRNLTSLGLDGND